MPPHPSLYFCKPQAYVAAGRLRPQASCKPRKIVLKNLETLIQVLIQVPRNNPEILKS